MAEAGQVAPKSAAVDPLLGRAIAGRFKIISLIARGGMGKVYRAEQAPLGRACAVKILNPNYAGEQDPEFHKRFFLEASIASKLTHPNTVTIFDYGQTDDDVYYMAMELLDGVTLHRAIREAGSFHEDRVAHICRQICRALREAHGHGVIHRDLKPANIFLTEHGDESDFVKVLDFGLVKNVVDPKPEDQLTQTGLFMGSPKYMAPEQIRGDRVDARTDVYSLGIMMYEMLTGKVPFDRANSLNTLMAQVNEDAPPIAVMNPSARVGPGMEELVARCMSKSPAGRPGSMDEVLAVLKRLGAGLSTTGTGEYAAVSGQHPLSVSASGSVPAAPRDFESARPPPSAMASAFSDATPSSLGGRGLPSQPPVHAAAANSQQIAVSLGAHASVPPDASATPPPIVMPELRKSRKALWAVMIGAAALAAVGFFLLRPGVDMDAPVTGAVHATQPPAPATPPPVAPAQAAPAPPPAVPASLTTHFTSDPPGASVKEDGKEVCTATPCDHAYDADVTHEHKLVFGKTGYRSETRMIHAGDTPVAVKLVAARAWTPPPPQAKAADTNAATPQGFKEIPY